MITNGTRKGAFLVQITAGILRYARNVLKRAPAASAYLFLYRPEHGVKPFSSLHSQVNKMAAKYRNTPEEKRKETYHYGMVKNYTRKGSDN